jgi:hypothetical protein
MTTVIHGWNKYAIESTESWCCLFQGSRILNSVCFITSGTSIKSIYKESSKPTHQLVSVTYTDLRPSDIKMFEFAC